MVGDLREKIKNTPRGSLVLVETEKELYSGFFDRYDNLESHMHPDSNFPMDKDFIILGYRRDKSSDPHIILAHSESLEEGYKISQIFVKDIVKYQVLEDFSELRSPSN